MTKLCSRESVRVVPLGKGCSSLYLPGGEGGTHLGQQEPQRRPGLRADAGRSVPLQESCVALRDDRRAHRGQRAARLQVDFACRDAVRVLHEARELPVVLAVGGVGVVDLLRREGANDVVERALQQRRAQLAPQQLVPKWQPAVLLECLPRGLGHGLVKTGEARDAPASREHEEREGSERECRNGGWLGATVVHGCRANARGLVGGGGNFALGIFFFSAEDIFYF